MNLSVKYCKAGKASGVAEFEPGRCPTSPCSEDGTSAHKGSDRTVPSSLHDFLEHRDSHPKLFDGRYKKLELSWLQVGLVAEAQALGAEGRGSFLVFPDTYINRCFILTIKTCS